MPLTPNENLIFGTQAERISVTPDSEQLIKDTTTQGLFVGDGTTAGGRAVDVRVIETVTGTYTLDRGDESKVLHFNSGSAFTVTIPTNASVPFPTGLTRIPFLNLGAGQVTLSASVGVTLSSSTTTVDQGESGYLVKLNTDEWFLTKGVVEDAQTLAGLTDVQLTSVSNGEAILYDAASGKWKNAAIPSSDTTYDLSIPTDTTKIRLAGSDGTNDDITITAGTGITVTRNSGTEMTIASTASDTTYSLGSTSAGANATIDLTPSSGSGTSVTLAAGSNITISETGSTITLASSKFTGPEAVAAVEAEAVLDLTGAVNIAGSLTVDTSTLKVDVINNRVGIANTTPETALDVGGTIRQDGATTGLVYADASGDLLGGRAITAGTGMSVTNGNGVGGNPTISTTITQYTDALAVAAVEAESTLALTGAVTMASTLGVTGNATMGGTLGITGNTTVGGTLGVTGLTTMAGATSTADININDGALNINEQYGRINFKKDATSGTATNYAIYFYDTSDQIQGGFKFNRSTSTLQFQAGSDDQLHINDGAVFPATDNDVDLGTSAKKFKDGFFGLVDTENFKVNGGQGSDGQVLTSTGSGVAWEAIPADTNTTYTLGVPDTTTKVRLTGSDSSTSDITITGGTNVTVTRASATELSISSVPGFSKYTDAEAVAAVEASDLTFSGTVDLSDGLTVGPSGSTKTLVADVTTDKVGVNIDTPTEALDVVGNFKLSGNAVIAGDLTVNGTTTTVNTATLSVEDPLILLSKNNTANSVDIGFVGKYVDTNSYYSGLVRDASASKFRLFTTTEDLSTATTVDPTNAGYAKADLVINDLDAQAISGTTITGTGAISGTTLTGSGAISGASISVTGNASAGGDLTVTGGAVFDTTTLVVDASNNRVGIGTASPTVDVDATGKTVILGTLQIGDSGESLSRPVDNELAISTGGTERIRIDSTGKVGIGTDPAVALDVSGAIKQTSVTSKVFVADATGNLVGVTDGSNGQMLTTDGSGSYSFTTPTGTYTDSMAIAAVEGESTLALTGAVTMASTLGVTGAITGASLSTTGAISGTTLTGVGSLTLTHAGTDVFADIIGPLNRNLRFVLRDNGDTDAFVWLNAADTEIMKLERTGHLGIGVSTPAYHVDAGGDINFTGTLRKSGTAFGLGDLGNVTLSSPSTNDRLVWNGSAWVNQARPADNNTTYTFSVPDTTTKLRLTGSDSTTDDVNITGGTNVTVTRVSESELSIASTDTNNTYALSSGTSGSNATIVLTAGGSGSGTSTVTLAGAGATSLSETGDTITITSTDTNTTYDLTVPAATTAIRLSDGSSNDDITIAGGGDTTVTRTSATQLTVSTTKYTDAEAVSAVEGEGTLNIGGITTFASDVNIDSGTLFADVSTNRVGIGTITPESSLNVNVNDATQVVFPETIRNTPNPIAENSGNFGVGMKLALSSGSGNELKKWVALAAVKSPDLNYSRRVDAAFYTQADAAQGNDPTEKMRITGDGLVGIGTSDPAHTLDVSGTLRVTGATTFAALSVTDLTMTGDLSIAENKAITFDSSDSFIKANTDDPEDLLIAADQDLFLMPDNDVVIQAGTTSYAIFDGSATRFGLGTTSPSTEIHAVATGADSTIRVERSSRAQLDLVGQNDNALIQTANDYPLNLGANATTVLTVTGTSRLGVNTTSPAKTLHVNGSSRIGSATNYFESSNGNIEFVHPATGQNYLDFKDDATDDFDSRIIKYGSSHASQADKLQVWNNTGILELKTNSHDVVVDSGTGVLKINRDTATANAGSVLSFTAGDSGANTAEHSYAQIAGLIGTNTNTEEDGYLKFSTSLDGTMTEYMRLDESGRLGIGTTSPDVKLDIEGTGKLLQLNSGNNSGTYMGIANTRAMVGYASDSLFLQGGFNKGIIFAVGNGTFGSGEVARFAHATGNLGLGETSPTFPLHLKYTDNRTDPQGSGSASGAGAIGADAEGGGLYIENASTTDGSWSGITFRTDTADARIAYQSVGSGLTNEGQMSFFLDTNDSPNQLVLEEVLRLRGGGSGGGQTFNSVDLPVDNARLRIGAGNDLQLLHNGTHSFIQSDTGELKILGSTRILNNDNNKTLLLTTDHATTSHVELYYNDSKKFETLSDGAKVTGRLHVTDSGDSIIVGSDNSDAGIFAYGTGKLVLGNDYDQTDPIDNTYSALIGIDGDGGTSSVIGLSNHISIETQRSGDDIFFKTGTNTANDGNLTTQMKIEGTGEIDLVSAKLKIGGSAGTAGQVLRMNAGETGIEWGSVSAGSSTTINNNADNRVITGSGTANTLEAESTFTFNAGLATLSGALPEVRLIDSDATNSPTARIINNNGNVSIRADSENVGTGGAILFTTSGTERARFSDAGRLGIGDTSPDYPLSISQGSGLAIQTANSGVREKRIYASQVDLAGNSSSPYDLMLYHSKGSTGGWSGSHNFLVDKSNGTMYEAMIVRDAGAGTKPEVMIGEGYTTASDPPGLLNLKSDQDILMHMENTGNLWVRFRVDTSGSDFHIDTNVKSSVISIEGASSNVTFSDDVIVTGDLTVNGTTTTVNTATLSVEDPLILLANGNTANTVDTGFVAKYTNTTPDPDVPYWSGLVRDASAGTVAVPMFRLFTTQEDLSTATVVDPTATGFSSAELNTSNIYIDYTVAGDTPGDGQIALVPSGSDNAQLRITTEHGYIGIGPTNTSYAHIQTDRTRFYFNAPQIIDRGTTGYNVSSYSNEDFTIATNNGTARVTVIGGTGTDAGRVGIATTAPEALLDVNTGSGIAIQMGADVNATSLTDETRKYGRFATPHYHNAEEPIGLVVGDSDGTDNIVNIGGGSNAVNAATNIRFWSAANDATTTGTERMRITSAGKVGIGLTSPTDSLSIQKTGGIKLGMYNETDGTGFAGSSPPSAHNDGTGASDPILRIAGRGTGQPGHIQLAQFDANNFLGGTSEFILGKISFASNENSNAVTNVAEIRGITSDPHTAGDFDGALKFLTSQGDGSSASLTEKMILTSDGYLGIGTTSPDKHLHVDAGTTNLGGIHITSGGANASLTIENDGTNGGTYRMSVSSGSHGDGTNKLLFQDGNVTRMTIDSAGDVGINQTNPAAQLHVKGSGNSWDKHIRLENHDTTDYGAIVVDSQGMKFRTFTNGHNFYFRDNDNNSTLFIKDAGSVGIGNVSPVSKLHVSGDTTIYNGTSEAHLILRRNADAANYGAAVKFQFGDLANNASGHEYARMTGNIEDPSNNAEDGYMTFSTSLSGTLAEKMRINSAGNIGLGTTSPTFTSGGGLHIKNSTQANLRLEDDNSEYFDVAMQQGNAYLINRVSDGFISLRTNSTERMNITSGGNIGIGTASPSYKVDIQPGTTVGFGLNVQNMIQDVNGRPNRNLIPTHQWTIGSGSVGNFSQNGDTAENERVWGAGPRQDGNGGRQILWKMTNQDTAGNGEGGWNTSLVPVDHTKTYRWTVWAKQVGAQSGSGSMTVYMGLRGYNAAGSNEGVLGSGGSGSANTNPYFWSGDLPVADKWYLIVGYAQGSGDTTAGNVGSGVYDPVTGKRVLTGTTYALQTTTTHVVHRAYLFYYETVDSDPDAYFWGPTLECCDGNETPLSTLLSHASSSSPGYFYSTDDETVVCIENNSASADANATLRLSSQHGSDTYVDLTENTYGNFSMTGGGSTRREFFRMTDHDTTTGVMQFDPTGIGFGFRVGSNGAMDQGVSATFGDDLGFAFSANAEMISIGGSSGTDDAGIVAGTSSSNATIMRFSGGTNSYDPYTVFNQVEGGTVYGETMTFKGGLAHFNVPQADLGSVTDARVQIKQGGINEAIRIDNTSNASIRFNRVDTGLAGGEIVGQLKFSSTDSDDTNINARMKVFKDDGGVSYAPMAFSFETGREGNETERMRITSDGMVHIGDTSPVLGITSGSPSMLQISSQTASQFPTLTLEYYDTTPNPDKYVVGQFLLGTNAVKVGSFDSNNSSLRLFTGNNQAMKIFGPDDADGERKVVFGGLETEPSYRMLIQGTDKETGASATGSSLVQFTNDTTGTSSSDGVLVGLDASENALIENKESGKKLRLIAPGNVDIEATETDSEIVMKAEGSEIMTIHNNGIEGQMGTVSTQNMKHITGFRPRRVLLRNLSGNVKDLNNNSAWVDIEFENQLAMDGSYFTQATNDYELTVVKSGMYFYKYKIVWDNTNSNRVVIKTTIRRNGTQIADTEVFAYSRGSSFGDFASNQGMGVIECLAGDIIKLSGRRDHADSGSTGACNTVAGDNYFQMWGWPTSGV